MGRAPAGRLAGWLLARLRPSGARRPRLELVERITLAPRQTLALVEAEGRRILVATSADGAPAFFSLDEPTGTSKHGNGQGSRPAARVSW